MFFFGAFGRRFVINPLFVFGMVFLVWGSAGLLFTNLSQELCRVTICPLLLVDYRPFWTEITGGALLISAYTIIQSLRLRFRHHSQGV
jgi:hypothetical protein